MLHVPVLRAGKPYRSIAVKQLKHLQTGEVIAEVSQANSGLIAKDLAQAEAHRRGLAKLGTQKLVDICRRASSLFMEADLEVFGQPQSPEDYVQLLLATTGVPHQMCVANMRKIGTAMDQMPAILSGLTRDLDLSQMHLHFRRETPVLGAILPNNSPGVHSLWLPAIALQVGLALRPGSQEPWSPYRIAAAMIAAGCPAEAFSIYPTDYNGANQILLRTGRSMFFGDANTIAGWKHEDKVQIHGPGWSKIYLAEDCASDWASYLDLMETSVAANGGRSCINASGIWTARHGRQLAEALAQRLATYSVADLDNPAAKLAAFTNPTVAGRISDMLDAKLAAGGAEDLSSIARSGTPRVVEKDGLSFLLPTILYTEDPKHPVCGLELLFPFATVVQCPQAQLLERIGPTLVLSAITKDQTLIDQLLTSPAVDRINIGPVATNHIRWDMPHEGNLFEHLYKARAYQTAAF